MSTTALAEYADMMFTRAHLALGHRDWWIEMRPDTLSVDPHGYVSLRARVRGPKPENSIVIVDYRASMHAIEENAQVSTRVMEDVVEFHLGEFAQAIKYAEEHGEPRPVE